MLKNILTGENSLWHYLKFSVSASYRRKVRLAKLKEQQTMSDLITKDNLLEETSLSVKLTLKVELFMPMINF